MTSPLYTPEDMVAIGDSLAAGLSRTMPVGLAWILIVTEPGQPNGALRSNFIERSSVAKALRRTLRTEYADVEGEISA